MRFVRNFFSGNRRRAFGMADRSMLRQLKMLAARTHGDADFRRSIAAGIRWRCVHDPAVRGGGTARVRLVRVLATLLRDTDPIIAHEAHAAALALWIGDDADCRAVFGGSSARAGRRDAAQSWCDAYAGHARSSSSSSSPSSSSSSLSSSSRKTMLSLLAPHLLPLPELPNHPRMRPSLRLLIAVLDTHAKDVVSLLPHQQNTAGTSPHLCTLLELSLTKGLLGIAASVLKCIDRLAHCTGGQAMALRASQCLAQRLLSHDLPDAGMFRAMLARFFRNVSRRQPASFVDRWPGATLALLLVFLIESADGGAAGRSGGGLKDARATLNSLFSRPRRTGLGVAIRMLLSNTIEVSHAVWAAPDTVQQLSEKRAGVTVVLCGPRRSRGRGTTNAVPVLVRCGSQTQQASLDRLLISVISTATLVYLSHIKPDLTGETRPTASASDDDTPSSLRLTVMACVQAMSTAATTPVDPNGASQSLPAEAVHAILRCARAAPALGHFILRKQLARSCDTGAGANTGALADTETSRRQELAIQLEELLQRLSQQDSGDALVPRRPATRASIARGPTAAVGQSSPVRRRRASTLEDDNRVPKGKDGRGGRQPFRRRVYRPRPATAGSTAAAPTRPPHIKDRSALLR